MTRPPSPGRGAPDARYRAPVDEVVPFSVAPDAELPARLVAAGELDATTAPVLREAIEALETGEEPVIVLDLTEVTFIDSSGLQAITSSLRRLRGEGRQLQVAGASRSVRRIFEVTGLADLLAGS